jgi:hypothetical protein
MNLSTDHIDSEVQPTRWSSLVFDGKAWGLRCLRLGKDLLHGRPRRHATGSSLRNAPVLADFEGHLWPKDEADQTLVAGKIQNLREAAKRLNGLEIPANSVFSFWRQLGRASERRGFVAGRELREGCIVPAIGGGLCQLSNAIYDSAVRAGLEVVERHRHSRALPGSLAEQDRDATVFWNYVDLRLRAPFAWRLEARLDESFLYLRIRAEQLAPPMPLPIHLGARKTDETGDCASCDKRACHRYTGTRQLSPHRTWLIDEAWPEFLAYLDEHRDSSNRVLGAPNEQAKPLASRLAVLRAWLRWRVALWRHVPIPQARTQRLETIANALTARLRSDDLHLVVAQGLLPYLWHSGELAGRRFDVLMNALPMTAIQRQLDRAASRHPACASLRDFRAPGWLIAAESEALAQAHRWISPHAQVLALAGARGEPLPWQTRPVDVPGIRKQPAKNEKRCLFFPASSLARKGVLELREAVRDLPIRLLLLGETTESPEIWHGFDVTHVSSLHAGIGGADLVVLPAWVEHQPRGLLLAIERGIPVIATDACGLPASSAWQRVAEGDIDALRHEIRRALAGIETFDAVTAD